MNALHSEAKLLKRLQTRSKSRCRHCADVDDSTLGALSYWITAKRDVPNRMQSRSTLIDWLIEKRFRWNFSWVANDRVGRTEDLLLFFFLFFDEIKSRPFTCHTEDRSVAGRKIEKSFMEEYNRQFALIKTRFSLETISPSPWAPNATFCDYMFAIDGQTDRWKIGTLENFISHFRSFSALLASISFLSPFYDFDVACRLAFYRN